MRRRGGLRHAEGEGALTFGLGDGGGGDGAEGGAAREGRVDAGHGDGVAHPRRRVNGSDRLVCTGGGEKRGPVTDGDRPDAARRERRLCTHCAAA